MGMMAKMVKYRKIFIVFFIILFFASIALAAALSIGALFSSRQIEPAESTCLPTETSVPKTSALETSVSEISVPETVALPATEPTQAAEETRPERIFYESVPIFYQTDYPDNLYGSGTIENSGCSITSLAMVASYMTGYEYTPDVLADYFGGYGQNNIQRLEHASDILQLPWKKAKDVRETLAAVKEGSLAIVLMKGKSLFTDGEHFIVLSGVTEDGKILINDPYQPNYDRWELKEGFKSGFKDAQVIQGYSGGWIYDTSAMPEEPFIYVEEKPYVEPRYPGITISKEDRTLLAKIIWVEARGEPAEGQQAIAEVVFNRMVSDSFPDTVRNVLYSSYQFPSTELLDKAKPTQAQYDAIQDALSGPYVLPIDVYHFATYPVNKNVWGTIGGHVFCYQA